ncbi:MAG: response regulator [Acidobacteria bacterium]|nr:response regulator [Acidobacteriota bacterium]
MATNILTAAASPGSRHPAVPSTQKVVVVNGNPDALELLERVFDAGHYDVVFIESNAHAYSQVKRVQPDLVVMCIAIDDLDGFRVLSMLNLDDETRDIPVLTYAMQSPDREEEEGTSESSPSALPTLRPSIVSMN